MPAITEQQLRAVLDGTEPLVLHTSGSTGHPKAVVLSGRALRASAEASAQRIGEGRWLLALPPHYIAGVQVLTRSLLAGTRPVVLDSAVTGGHFDPHAFVDAAAQLGTQPRYTSLVPAQLSELLDAGAAPTLQSFAAVLVGGQRTDAALAARAQDAGIHLVRTYGSSETAGGCVYDGVPLPGVDVRVIGHEVQLTGPMLAEGYRDEPERTAAVFVTDADGTRWYRTGDAGSWQGGTLQVTGRLDNVIVSGGVNVSLDRVEQVVRGLPGLHDAVVVGVSDDRWGEASVVVVPLREDPGAVRDRVREAVGAELGAPARPARIVDAEVPLLSSGKPDRQAARQLAESRLWPSHSARHSAEP